MIRKSKAQARRDRINVAFGLTLIAVVVPVLLLCAAAAAGLRTYHF